MPVPRVPISSFPTFALLREDRSIPGTPISSFPEADRKEIISIPRPRRSSIVNRKSSIVNRTIFLLVIVMASLPALSNETQRVVRYQSAHFTVLAPAGEEMGRLLDELERAYADVRAYGLSLPSMVETRCHATTDQFVRRSGGNAFNLALARGARIDLQPLRILLGRRELPRALRHELTHVALAGAARKSLPRWMNEGMAMMVAGEKHPESIKFARLDQLEDSLTRSRSHEHIRSAYGTAGRLVSRLAATVGKERLLAFLRGVATGGEFEKRFKALTGKRAAEWGAAELKQ
jgi:hypothetical protein